VLNKLISLGKKSRYKNTLKKIYKVFFKSYPFLVGKEISMIENVLKSGIWNMSNPLGIHSILEKEFAEYVGVKHAIVVNTGGVAIQMSLRVLDVNHGDEVIHQVDTCIANSFAIMNAGATPIFSDISLETFKLDIENLDQLLSSKTKVIMPIHLWGNVENMQAISEFAVKHDLKVIEDCALAFGAEYDGKKVGQFGDIGIFSFGSTKPIQAGEGGIIVTNDDELAKKLRSMRSWGEMTQEYGIRDHEILSWNGRASEIVVAVMLEQFRNFEKRHNSLKRNINFFIQFIRDNKYLELADESSYNSNPSFSQVVVRLNKQINKSHLMNKLKEKNISVWHANFELIPTISFFKKGTWKNYSNSTDLNFIENNYFGRFKNAELVYDNVGLGFMPNNFLTLKRTKNTIKAIMSSLEKL
jgi:perosamine synthetase